MTKKNKSGSELNTMLDTEASNAVTLVNTPEKEDDNTVQDNEFQNNFLSPIAKPLLDGKLLERALKLLKKSVAYEQSKKDTLTKTSKASLRQLKRGVAEVTKAIRKGQKGIVFIASDVYPIDIVAHFPVFCEDKDILYCFSGTKRKLGAACRTKRPASVVMVAEPSQDMPHHELYGKFHAVLKECHPYF